MELTTELETPLEAMSDPLLPDGWQDGDTLFDESELNGTEDDLLADEKTDLSDLIGTEEQEAETQVEAPTTDTTETEAVESDTEPETTPDPDGVKEEQKPVQRIVPIKYRHKTEDLDINAMSDEDIATAIQKSRAYDDLKKAQDKETYRKVYQEELDAGMTERSALIAARDAAGGQTFSLTDEAEQEEVEQEETVVSKPESVKPSVSDRETDMENLQILYPDAPESYKKLPDRVRLAVERGVPLLTAYQAYHETQRTEAVEALKKENFILTQNAASAEKAPPVVVTGGGATPKEQKKDPFEAGLDEGWDY